jgi:hypothetical protein
LAALIAKRSSCLRRLGGNRAGTERFRRFLHNERVTREIMLSTAAEPTARAAQGRHVLAIQDTTEFNFSGHAGSKRGFGVVGIWPRHRVFSASGDRRGRGLGRSARGRPLRRHPGSGGRFRHEPEESAPGGRKLRERERRKARPIATKESGRWIDGLTAAQRVLGGAATVTVVSDCESDIYELFAAPRAPHVHLIVRAEHDRCLSDGAKLFAAMAASPQAVGWPIAIPAKPGQPARTAQVSVSFQRIEIVRPHYGYQIKRLPPRIALNAVRVAEIDPPEGVKPILWLLLTTHEVATVADAAQVIGWYRARWTVEQVFRTTKTQGFDLEASQIETPAVMAKLAVAVLIGALRTMQLVYARSGATGQKLSDAMDEAAEPLVEALTQKLQGKTEKLKNPHAKGSLARLAWVVGRLGGWDGYEGHGYKPAGPKTMAIGLAQFDAIRIGWEMPRGPPLHPDP